MATSDNSRKSGVRPPRGRFRESIRRSLVTGTALTIPFIVTLMILGVVLDFVSRTLNPVVDLVEYFQLGWVPDLVVEASTLPTLLTIVLVVGVLAEHTEIDRVTGGVHAAMEAIPGVGSIYNGFRRMSDVLIESDVGSFQEVKLVEFPHEGTFSLGYLTGHPGETIRQAAGHDRMRTVFMPLAPNPVMGGFLVYLPEERIRDIDMTIEESVQAIVTSGVATSTSGPERPGTRAETRPPE